MTTVESSAVGILGVAVALPDEVRENTWWAEELTSGWLQKATRASAMLDLAESPRFSAGEQRAMQAMAEAISDPFQGSRRRRVAPPDESSETLEIKAATAALDRARVSPRDVGLVLTHSGAPDYLGTNSACVVHHALGLPSSTVALPVEAACNSFLLQLRVARAFLREGTAKYALLVQSALGSRLLDFSDAFSPYFGDGASAVVLGPVPAGLGIVGEAHRTHSDLADNLVVGIRGQRWYDEGRPVLYWEDQASASKLLLQIADQAREVCLAALDDAQLRPDDVSFFAAHQGTCWLRRVVQEHIGLPRARSLDTFAELGNLSSVNIPVILGRACDQGILRNGDVVLTFSGGSGVTVSSFVMKWAA